MQKRCQSGNVYVEKIEILEEKKHPDIGTDTYPEQMISMRRRCASNEGREKKIERDEREHYENVARHERHVENTARGEEKNGAIFLLQKVIHYENYRKKDRKRK
jgi:hypothetical protein